MAVYLLHFDRPHPNGRHPRHYIGWAVDLAARVAQHAAGTSRARLVEVMHSLGIRFTVARVWPDGDRALERRLKNWNKGAALCPLCKQGERQLPLPFPARPAFALGLAA